MPRFHSGPQAWLAAVACLVVLASWTADGLAQSGQGPSCDLQFKRNAKRNARVVICFQPKAGGIIPMPIQVDGNAADATLPTTPAEMAAALCAVINARPDFSCTVLPGGIVCASRNPGFSPIRRWSVAARDGSGGLVRNMGPGPTNPGNPSGPPPTVSPELRRLAPTLHLTGSPTSNGTITFEAFGGPVVQTPVPPGAPPDGAAQQFVQDLQAAGYGAQVLGPGQSFLGDPVEFVQVLSTPGGDLVEKIIEFGFDEADSLSPSDLGYGIEMAEADALPATSNVALAGLAGILVASAGLLLWRRRSAA